MIVFLSNFLNHHQYPVAAELFRITGGDYRFIEMEPIPGSVIKKSGKPDFSRPEWLIKAWENEDTRQAAREAFIQADVAVYGGIYPYEWIDRRLDAGRITFEYGERWLKRGILNILSPRLIRHFWHYHRHWHGAPLFRLNAGAFAAADMRLFRSFPLGMFKWGYFTDVPEYDTPAQLHKSRGGKTLRIMWCGNLIKLKRPDMAVRFAESLAKSGVKFKMDIYGAGEMKESLADTIKRLNLDKEITLCGNLRNSGLMQKMSEADIFLFTSGRREGWGAVVNEAMSRGCAVIASDQTGCAPWLIKDGHNGILFRSGDLSDLIRKSAEAVENADVRMWLGFNAYRTIRDMWSPASAAQRFVKLSNAVREGDPIPFNDGPCSPD